ncbi:MAG: mandelate racemase [Planctomycetaceae bacterium]
MTETPHVFVRVEIEVDGTHARGIAADHLPPKWFTKNPRTSFDEEIREMRRVILHAVRISAGLVGETVFSVWRTLYQKQKRWGKENGLPALLSNFGCSLVERALIEAFCRATQTTFAQAARENSLGIQWGELDAGLTGKHLSDFLPAQPARELTIRQTLGIADPLTDDEIAPANRVNDGLPESLEGLIRRYGLQHFKMKITGEAETDIEQLKTFLDLIERFSISDFRFTIDGNELFHSLEGFQSYWNRITEDARINASLSRLLFVEQPFHRDIALDAEHLSGLDIWRTRPPILIDESDADLESLPRALSLGYSGTSHKNCKGVFKSLLNFCRLEHLRRSSHADDMPLLMSVEDLVNIGPVALQQDLAVAALLGISSVERNGHHYFAGLSAFPNEVQQQVLHAHPDLFERHSSGGYPVVKMNRGKMCVESVNASPFGVGFELEVSQFPPLPD